jgi:hypothetical protein
MIPQNDRRNPLPGKDKPNIKDRFSLYSPYEDAPPDLAAVVAAWPDLPEPIRSGILAMVRAAAPGKGVDVEGEPAPGATARPPGG